MIKVCMVDVKYRCKRIQLLSLTFFDANKIDAVRIMDEGLPRLTGKFVLDEKFVFILQANDGSLLKVVWNNLVMNNLERQFGSETKNWIGKVLNVVKVSQDGKEYLDFIPVDSIKDVVN